MWPLETCRGHRVNGPLKFFLGNNFFVLINSILQNNMLLMAKFVIFLYSVISQGKAVALDR